MLPQGARYTSATSISLAEGWSLARLIPPSRLFGANGLRSGPDGRIYVAQVAGSQISALNVDTAELETISAQGADIVAPADVAFDPAGNLYATEYYDGRVSVRGTDGRTRVLRGDVPGANGITFHRGRLFIDECRIGGRLLELDPGGGAPRVLLENLPLPNAMEFGPFVGNRLFVSSFTGQITEILGGGRNPKTRAVLPSGLTWPLDLTVGNDGTLYVSDGTYFYALRPGGELQMLGRLFSPGWPGYIRGVTATGPGEFVVTTSNGQVARWRPASSEHQVLAGAAEPLDQLYGVAVAPDGSVVAAELGAGRVVSVRNGEVATLASGLNQPVGVAFGADGTCLVSESGTGRVVSVTGSGVDTLVDGLEKPHGIAVRGGRLYIGDAGAKALVEVDLDSKARTTIARDLPVGAPLGVEPKPLKGLPPFSGPQGLFAGLAAGGDGTLYVSADGDGSVLAIRMSGGASGGHGGSFLPRGVRGTGPPQGQRAGRGEDGTRPPGP